jgi:prepilin-type N-terminal cleavage/methylation domain-containing protein/prepilin-type processing-associated H-X9-DG protein
MNGHARRGFTLTELMVVIGILGLIVATVLPYFERVYAIQRKVACANNLEKIGQAFGTWGAHGAITHGGRRSDVSTIFWQKDLLNYLSGEGSVYSCPDSREQMGMAETARQKLKDVYIEVFQGSALDYNTWLWDVPLDEEFASEWVWRLSDEQFVEMSNTPGHGQNYDYQGYQEGADPTTYWFVFEDQGALGGGDRDYYDIFVKIHVTETQIELTPKEGAAGFNFALCIGRGDEKEYLSRDMKSDNGKPLTLSGGGLGRTDYGLNSVVNLLRPGSKKLLVLDYEVLTARGSDFDDPHEWLEDELTFPTKIVSGRKIPVFFRHFDKANVLFYDGSVKLMGFDEITIYDDEARERYWNP